MAKKKKRIEKKVTIGSKRVSVYGFSAFEIQQKIEALQNAEERKKFPLFNEVLDLWQEEHFENIALGTQTCYKPAIKRAENEFKGIRLCDITPMDITALLQQLAFLGYSHQTVKIQRVVIGLVFKYAQSKGFIQNNPAEHAEMPPKLPKKIREIPDDDAINIVMKSADKPFGEFALFLLMTGCRRGEALALKWSDIDFDKKVITVNKNIVYNGNQAIVEQHTKTSAGMRKVVLLDILYNLLLPMKENAMPADYIFGNGDTPLTQSQFRRRWEQYLKETEIKITPHQLRHAYATILFDAHIDEKVAQTFMGHSKIEITRNVYTHIRQQRATHAQTDLNEYISKNLA